MKEQVCAREIDGIYYRCEAGCCKEGKGCPGQCKDAGPAPAYKVIPASEGGIFEEEYITDTKMINALVLTLIAIAVLRLVVATASAFRG
jgi:hypothetical protein